MKSDPRGVYLTEPSGQTICSLRSLASSFTVPLHERVATVKTVRGSDARGTFFGNGPRSPRLARCLASILLCHRARLSSTLHRSRSLTILVQQTTNHRIHTGKASPYTGRGVGFDTPRWRLPNDLLTALRRWPLPRLRSQYWETLGN